MPLTPPLPERAALLLDLDGTLLDIAPTPASVIVPPLLPGLLRRLRAALDDALAVVTGRPIEQIDDLLGDAPFAVAGEHGAAIRHAPGGAVARSPAPPVPQEWLRAAEAAAARHPGALVEAKRTGFVLHYRLAPEAGPHLRAAAQGILGEAAPRYAVLPAHMAWEIKPLGADKGSAVASLMATGPFAGRVPVYIGDDVTDEDGMRAAREAGGLGFRVDETFGDAAGVRVWLAQAAAQLRPAA